MLGECREEPEYPLYYIFDRQGALLEEHEDSYIG